MPPSVADTAGAAIGRPRGVRRPRLTSVSGLVIVLWIVCAFVVLLPLSAIIVLAGDGSRLAFLFEADILEAAANSLVSALSSALFAVVLGTAFSYLLDRSDLPGRAILRLLALSPLLMPPFVGAIAWIGVAGPTSPVNLWWREAFGSPLWSIYGGDGVIMLLTIHSYPIVMLIVSAALRRIPSDLEQAARIAGAGPLRAATSVTVPLLRPALASSFIVVAVGNLADFGIPSIIGLPERFVTLATLVYRYLQSGTVDDPLQVAATIGVVILVLAVLGLAANALIMRRGHQLDVSTAVVRPLRLGAGRIPLGIGMWILILGVTVLPLCALLMQTLLVAPGVEPTWDNLTLDHLTTALTTETALQGAANSVGLAVTAALVCGILGLAIGVVVARVPSRVTTWLGGAAMLPQAIPGIVIAVAWLALAPTLGLFNTPWLILAAYITSFLALVVQAVAAPLETTPASAEEAARVAGAGRLRSLIDITCRMATPAAVSGALLVAVTAARELTLSVLLLSPGSQTLGVAIFNFQQAGAFSTASAWSLIVAVVGLGFVSVITRRLK
ncbi:ABC transporter permease [Brevibacterium casei]|uniref:Iron ABC transporter permease n=2 Tax=Brevibacterium casei TaxID=33889 RepID=A0A7T2TIA8_9MICO|nr:iron ABC transporter permease [Brevibacterium casei]QPS34374.1 iron ABC transporter permease [Brevibacterium casei]